MRPRHGGFKEEMDLLVAWLIPLAFLWLHLIEAAHATTTTSSLPLVATLSRGQSLVSSNGVFELGFFPSSEGGVFAFGIWYAQLTSLQFPTVVWTPRRDLKLGKDAYLQLAEDGTLQLFNPAHRSANNQPVWSSGNTPLLQAKALELQDTGNLVLVNATESILWQSFDTPTDTLLPGQSLYAAQSRALVSWRDAGDWSDEGWYSCSWRPINGTQTLSLSWNGASIASWNASSWSNTSVTVGNVTTYPYFNDSTGGSDFIALDPENGNFYAGDQSSRRVLMSSTSQTSGPLRRVTLDRNGGLRLYSWTIGTSAAWSVESNLVQQPCAVFAECGPYGVCSPSPDSPAYLSRCSCPEGFENVDANDEFKGCKRRFAFPPGECVANTTKLAMQKVGDMDYPFANRLYPWVNTTETACIALCLHDCRCEGAVFWRRDGRCFIKSGPLFNGGFPQDVGNHSAYLKILTAPLYLNSNRMYIRLILGLVVPCAAFLWLGLGLVAWRCWQRRRLRYCEPLLLPDHVLGPRKYTLRELSAATRNFNQSELIGRGGMGSVYKGVLKPTGAVVAVKRIRHEASLGGEQGFLAEASSISQIRHRNLAQLKGWCIEDGKFLLVYDYMSNGSLDKWLFSGYNNVTSRAKELLSWNLRYSIITGVAAALAYLHEDWQQCVLHRDIKSSNVLLDAEFNAHLGDFGLARLIDHQKMEKTTSMAGTLGYMAPEMPYTGKATKETDVYSFGVLMLEVVCGKRPMVAYDHELEARDAILLHRVWCAHEAGDLLTAVDPRLRIRHENNHATDWAEERSKSERSKPLEEVADFAGALTRRIGEERAREDEEQTRVLTLGLLCCLPNPSARPCMRLVHQILSGDVIAIPPLPNTNQFKHLDVMAAIHNTFHPHPLSSLLSPHLLSSPRS